MVSLFVSFALAGVIYELYWHLVSRWNGITPRWLGRSRAEQRLRDGRRGYLRLVISWALVLIVYTLGAGSTHSHFSFAWWREPMSAGDVGFIAVMAPLLAVLEWYFTRQPAGRSSGAGDASGLTPAMVPVPVRQR